MNNTKNIFFLNSTLNIRQLIPSHYSSYVIITDDNIAHLFAKDIIEQLKGLKVHLITFPSGECNKNRRTKEKIEDKMIDFGCDRNSCIIALGGGVVSDMAGFTAATYQRGIDYYNIPTTLMAMVDASIGGKTALNTESSKNMIGAFYQPKQVFININFLKTLPYIMYMSGLAEMMKIFLVRNRQYFEEFYENFDNINSNQDLLREYIERAIKLKLEIVEQDIHDKNLRNILNFGHTIGHALERASNYTLPHGYAVVYGIVEESIVSSKMNILDQESLQKIKDIAKHWKIDFTYNLKDFRNALTKDKKQLNNKVRFVILENIGKAHFNNDSYVHEIPDIIANSILEDLKP